jgi:zinc/manganese transport system ATP-binding protein
MNHCNPVIRLENVSTAYEGAARPTLSGISLEVRRGEYVVIGGPNGAGKTTLLETINGMLPVTHGNAMVCGYDIRHDGVHVRCRVGYLIQNFAFDPLTPFTVEEVVLMGRFGRLGLFRKPRPEDRNAARSAIALLKIEHLATRPIGQLSGGQQQKVLLAQNLARNPEVLLLDEPFSNLDFLARDEINALLSGLVEKGITVIIVSHAFDDLPDRTIRVVVMQEGRICRDSTCNPREVESVVRAAGGIPVHA